MDDFRRDRILSLYGRRSFHEVFFIGGSVISDYLKEPIRTASLTNDENVLSTSKVN